MCKFTSLVGSHNLHAIENQHFAILSVRLSRLFPFRLGVYSMRKLFSFLFVFAVSSVMAVSAFAAGKDVKLEGEGQCAKCSLGIADKCQNVLVVTKDGKSTNYFLDGEKSTANHKALCKGVHKTKVTGSCTKKGDKLVVEVSTIEIAK